MHTSNAIGIGLCLAAVMLWGGQFPLMGTVFVTIDPFTFTSLRYLLAALVLLLPVLLNEGMQGLSFRDRKIPLAWLIGTIGFCGFNLLIFQGQKMLGDKGALVAAVMVATQPMLGLIVTGIIHRKWPHLLQLGCMLLSFIGVLMVVTQGHITVVLKQPHLGAVAGLMLLGSLSWVLYTIGPRFFPQWSVYRYSALTCLLSLPVMLTTNILLFYEGVIPTPKLSSLAWLWPQLGYMSLFSGVLAVLCWTAGNRRVGANNGILFMNVVPLTTLVISTIQGIPASIVQLLGVCCVCLALVFNNLYLRHQYRSRERGKHLAAQQTLTNNS